MVCNCGLPSQMSTRAEEKVRLGIVRVSCVCWAERRWGGRQAGVDILHKCSLVLQYIG